MLDVDVNALSLWLERDALPKISDADPAALAEYILALLDTIDLSHLNEATNADCVAKLSDFFDSHTPAFVDALFAYLQQHRKPQQHPPPQVQAALGAPSKVAESRTERRSRSRSPARCARSRSRSRERGGRRKRSPSPRSDSRDAEREPSNGHEARRGGGGTLLIRDERFGTTVRVSQRGRDHRGVAAGQWDHRNDRREGWQHSDLSCGQHSNSRSTSSTSSPLVIPRPYVPPRDGGSRPSRPLRTVQLPSSNPFASAPEATRPAPVSDVVRVGNHTVVKRRRPAERSPERTSVLVQHAPRFVLSMRMLTDHFTQFGALRGVEIRESDNAATIRFASAAEAQRAVSGRPLHPAAITTLDIGHTEGRAQSQEDGEEEEEMDAEEADEAEENQDARGTEGTEEAAVNGDETASTTAAPAGATIAVGKRTLTLKPKPPPLSEAHESIASTPVEASGVPAPVPGSALYTAQLIRQQKASVQSAGHSAFAQPQLGEAVLGSAAAPKQAMSGTVVELKKSQVKLALLQKQIDQAVALVERLDVLLKTAVEGTDIHEQTARKKAAVEQTLEESRRQWRKERGKVVLLSLGASGAAATGAL